MLPPTLHVSQRHHQGHDITFSLYRAQLYTAAEKICNIITYFASFIVSAGTACQH